jgi:cobalt-zinc-cadmium efflux system membrane fusion protein
MSATDRNPSWPAIVAALVLAAGLGFGLARLTGGSSDTERAAPESPAGTDVAAPLAIPDSSLTMMGIVLQSVAPGNLSAEIQAPATVSAAPNGQAIVTARATGTLVRLDKRLGDQVAAGETLALVESRDAAAMAAERSAAESKAVLARSIFKREQSLYEQKVTPRQDLEMAQAELAAAEAEAARANMAASAAGVASDGRSLALVSPIAGRITFANVALGAYVEPGMELFRVADPRFVAIEAAVPAADAKRINVGDRAGVTTAAGVTLDATVVSVTPTLNEQTRAATVTLSLSSDQGAPTPGEFVRARITVQGGDASGFVVPDEAVQSLGGRDAVFVREGTTFRPAPVVVAARSGGRASIVSGLKAGDVIATKNAFLLKAEAGKGAEEDE